MIRQSDEREREVELAQDDRFPPVCSIQHPDPLLVSSALVLFSFDVSEVKFRVRILNIIPLLASI